MLADRLEHLEFEQRILKDTCASLYRRYCIEGDTDAQYEYDLRLKELQDLSTEIMVVKHMMVK